MLVTSLESVECINCFVLTCPDDCNWELELELELEAVAAVPVLSPTVDRLKEEICATTLTSICGTNISSCSKLR